MAAAAAQAENDASMLDAMIPPGPDLMQWLDTYDNVVGSVLQPTATADELGTEALMSIGVTPEQVRDAFEQRISADRNAVGGYNAYQQQRIQSLLRDNELQHPYANVMNLVRFHFSHYTRTPNNINMVPRPYSPHNQEWNATRNATNLLYPVALHAYTEDAGNSIGMVIRYPNQTTRLRAIVPFAQPNNFLNIVGGRHIRVHQTVRDQLWDAWLRHPDALGGRLPSRVCVLYELRQNCMDLMHMIPCEVGTLLQPLGGGPPSMRAGGRSYNANELMRLNLVVPVDHNQQAIANFAASWQVLLSKAELTDNRYIKGIAPYWYNAGWLDQNVHSDQQSALNLQSNVFVWDAHCSRNRYFRCMQEHYGFQPKFMRYRLRRYVPERLLAHAMTNTLKQHELDALAFDSIGNAVRWYHIVERIRNATSNLQRPLTASQFRRYVRNPDQELETAWHMISLLAPQSSAIVQPYRSRNRTRRPSLRL